jgi:hypothetical protein
MHKILHNMLRNEAGDLPADGGAPPAAAAPAAAAPAAPAAAAPAAASLLATGAEPATLTDLVPEKFRAVKEDGTLDADGTLRKLAGSYTELEKRLGTAETAPKSADEYKLEGLPDSMDLEALKTDEKYQGFMKGAHAKGMTSAQVSYVLQQAADRGFFTAGKDGEGAPLTAEAASAALSEVWADKATFDANVRGAYKATAAYAERAGVTMEQIEAAGLGNNPVFARIMAALAPDLGEDTPTPVHQTGAGSGFDIAAARSQLLSMNPRDPSYATLRAQVDGWYAKQYGTNPVS